MNKKVLFLIFMSVFAGLNLGSVRQAEDPVRDTQTHPILYKQKQEEEKDGKKGPVMYHVKNNPKESFFIDPPFEKGPGNLSGEVPTQEDAFSSGAADWWEEPSQASRETPSAEKESEPLPEPEDAGVDKPAAEPVSGTAESSSAPGGDESWW